MTTLKLYGRIVPTVFDLLGENENDMTRALGFALSRSEQLLEHFMSDLGLPPIMHNDNIIQLQTGRAGIGITDIEIMSEEIKIVIEAKIGTELPLVSQLERYATLCCNPFGTATLVAITNATPEYADHIINILVVPGVDIIHRSWRQIRRLAQMAHATASGILEKNTLSEFISYLGGILDAEIIFSNRVYVVSLGGGYPKGWKISWMDIVQQHHKYFYPVGIRSWPTQPPNYIGVRYDGRLQRIYHVCNWEIVPDLRVSFDQPNGPDWSAQYLLHLDSEIIIHKEVLNGPRVSRSLRVWCMLDTLLTCNTISEALTMTEQRIANAENN
jgi:hypothetical protein